MSKIRVKNFGPIEGGLENNQFLEMDKVALLIGNQATGKSSVAKLFSTISWLEKSLFRGDSQVGELTRYNRFRNKYCAYQGIENYFKTNTEIEYIGSAYHFLYSDKKLIINKLDRNNEQLSKYLPPKIMYVPAERNFLSIVEKPEQLKYLPKPLYTFLDEFERSKSELKEAIQLPINTVQFEYQKQNKISYIKGDGFKIKLNEASSGIQSLLPVFLVSRNLAISLNRKGSNGIQKTSIEQNERLREKILDIIRDAKLSEDLRTLLLEQTASLYENECFINIVEEIEQNLFPTSQRNLLNELLRYNNLTKGNKLILTSHSPYILNYLTLAIKGKALLELGIRKNKKEEVEEKVSNIIPIQACTSFEKMRIYEFLDNGNIRLLSNYQGIPSDSNFLNQFLNETNQLFDQLLDIEDTLL